MPTVNFVNEKVTAEAADGQDIRSVARQNGIELYEGPHKVVNCMGMGMCGSCTIATTNGQESCSPPSLRERFVAKLLNPLFFLKIISNEDIIVENIMIEPSASS